MADQTWPDPGALGEWMAKRLPDLDGTGDVRVDGVERLEAGYSADTTAFSVAWSSGGERRSERFVLRSETGEPAVYPQQAPGLDVEIEIQHRAMSEVAERSSVPVAPLVGFEPDPGVLGRAFFVMGFVEGQVPRVSPPYTTSGFFVDGTPDDRAAMIGEGLRILADLHAIDLSGGAFGWLRPPGVELGTAHHLAVWEDYGRRELGDRTHPVFDRASAWLHANVPTGEPLVFTWGDPRLGNMIWRDFRCVCVTDFENVALAAPDQDLGWWLMFDRWSHEVFGADRLPGEPTRDEQRRLYCEASGRDVGDTTFHEIFAAFRYTAIVVRIMNRSVERGQAPSTSMTWLDNPISTMLAAMLDEQGVPA